MKRPTQYAPLSAFYFDDDAIMEVGEVAELMYVRGLAYAARKPDDEGNLREDVVLYRLGIRPDCMVALPEAGPETDPERGPETDPERGPETVRKVAAKLVRTGLWEAAEGGYRIAGWLRWNRSRTDAARERQSDRARKAAKKSGSPVSGPSSGPSSGPRSGSDSEEQRTRGTDE